MYTMQVANKNVNIASVISYICYVTEMLSNRKQDFYFPPFLL